VKEVKLLDADGIVKKNIMAFKLKNKELKKIVGQLKKSATMHAEQAKKLEKMSPLKEAYPGGPSVEEVVAKKQQLPMKSPMKGKLKPCQKAAARKKFDVYPSAYANMWASKHKC
jgi:hypothetical protein